jgi:hypothetical protein
LEFFFVMTTLLFSKVIFPYKKFYHKPPRTGHLSFFFCVNTCILFVLKRMSIFFSLNSSVSRNYLNKSATSSLGRTKYIYWIIKFPPTMASLNYLLIAWRFLLPLRMSPHTSGACIILLSWSQFLCHRFLSMDTLCYCMMVTFSWAGENFFCVMQNFQEMERNILIIKLWHKHLIYDKNATTLSGLFHAPLEIIVI